MQRTRPGRVRSALRVEGAHRPHERGDVGGEPVGVLHRARDGMGALDPAAHRPRPRAALAGLAECERHGHRIRQRRRDARQPRELPLERRHRPPDPRHPHRAVRAEAVHGVVGAARRDRLDGKRRPLGELRGDEPRDERGIRLDLVIVHAHHRTTLAPAPGSARARGERGATAAGTSAPRESALLPRGRRTPEVHPPKRRRRCRAAPQSGCTDPRTAPRQTPEGRHRSIRTTAPKEPHHEHQPPRRPDPDRGRAPARVGREPALGRRPPRLHRRRRHRPARPGPRGAHARPARRREALAGHPAEHRHGVRAAGGPAVVGRARRPHRQPGRAAGARRPEGDLPQRLAGRGRREPQRPDLPRPVALPGELGAGRRAPHQQRAAARRPDRAGHRGADRHHRLDGADRRRRRGRLRRSAQRLRAHAAR